MTSNDRRCSSSSNENIDFIFNVKLHALSRRGVKHFKYIYNLQPILQLYTITVTTTTKWLEKTTKEIVGGQPTTILISSTTKPEKNWQKVNHRQRKHIVMKRRK